MNAIVKEIPSIQSSPEDIYVIHFSYGATNNANHFGQRIFCIYAQNLSASESCKFSIEKYAKKSNIDISVIADWYDDLELSVLDDFNDFLKGKSNCTFIYWAEDGHELMLEAIKSRFEELNKEDGKTFCIIPTSTRKSIQYLVKKIEKDAPKDLKEFIKKFNNQQVINGYLDIGAERNCFDKKDYNKLGESVISKVNFFVKVINECASKEEVASHNSKDKNDIDPIEIRSLSPMHLFSRLTIGSWLVVCGLIGGAFWAGYGLKQYLDSEVEKKLNDDKTKAENTLMENSANFNTQENLLKDSISQLQKSNLSLSKLVKEKSDSLRIKRLKTN